MSDLSEEQKIKHLQLALSMVGVSANLMTCELIKSIAAAVDKKGFEFCIRDANDLAESIAKKYKQTPPMRPMTKEFIDDASIIEGEK